MHPHPISPYVCTNDPDDPLPLQTSNPPSCAAHRSHDHALTMKADFGPSRNLPKGSEKRSEKNTLNPLQSRCPDSRVEHPRHQAPSTETEVWDHSTPKNNGPHPLCSGASAFLNKSDGVTMCWPCQDRHGPAPMSMGMVSHTYMLMGERRRVRTLCNLLVEVSFQ